MYKADSKIAEEFINHQEILDTMSYAETHMSSIPPTLVFSSPSACFLLNNFENMLMAFLFYVLAAKILIFFNTLPTFQIFLNVLHSIFRENRILNSATFLYPIIF